MPSTNPVAARLSEKNLKRALIVDDAFDRPTRKDLAQNELADFWQDLDPDSSEQIAMLEALLGFVPDSEEEIDDASVAILYEQRDSLGPLQVAFDTHLRAPLSSKHGHLDPLIEELDNLGLHVVPIGTADPVDQGQAELIFLDYYLGDPKDSSSVQAARSTVIKLLRLYPVGSEKPLVVLMSSDDDVKSLAEDFRRETGIVGGMFYFLPKSDLTDRVKLLLNLDMLAMALPDGHRIQKFIDSIENKMKRAVQEFLTDIKRLNIDDYVYFQRLCLQPDGHPLGDYLLWLYSAYFGHLLFENALGTDRRELDQLTFEDWVPSQVLPSTQLTAMYHAALFDTTVGALSPHPRWASGEKEGTPPPGTPSEQGEELAASQNISGSSSQDAKGCNDQGNGNCKSGIPILTGDEAIEAVKALPYFSIGDIFINSELSELLMVCNPACDLEFTPDGERLPNSKDSIMFIPGLLEKLAETSKKPALRTELFRHGEQSYRILWLPKQLRAIPYAKVETWLSKHQYSRVARLRMPFSLEIQHDFANQLTRVGVPVPPPFYRPLEVALYRRGNDGSHDRLSLANSEKEAFIIATSRGEEKCAFTAGLIRAIQKRVGEISEEAVLPLGNELEETELKQRTRANKRIEKARKVGRDFLAWREISELFTIPDQGKSMKFNKAGILVSRDVSTDGQWKTDALLTVHLSESLAQPDPSGVAADEKNS